MASPEELVTTLPDTLPEDFGEWDGEGPPSDGPGYSWDSESPHKTIPVYSGEPAIDRSVDESSKPAAQSARRKATSSAVTDELHVPVSDASALVLEPQKDFIDRDGEVHTPPKRVDSTEWKSWESVQSFAKTSQPAQSAERKAVSLPAVDKAQVSDSVSATPVAAKKQEPISAVVDKSSSQAAIAAPAAPARQKTAAEDTHERAETLRREADEAIYQLFSARNVEVKPTRKPVGKKRMIVAAVGGSSFLLSLVLIISLFHHGAKVAAQQSVQPVQAATDTQPIANKPKPSAGEPLAQEKTAAVTATQQTAVNQPASDTEQTSSAQTPTETQTQMMNDQLAAPTRIPRGANQQVAENEPASAPFGAAGAEGLGSSSANVGIFGSHAQTVVKAPPPKPVVISSGVAAGMLIHKTPPSYPPIAKAARVSGTVELHATISKGGLIEGLQVVNGPAMLRQAAADAVRTWRFQPYKLNNEPTEVETTINVVFTLGG
jgi:protein TonB